MHIGFSKKIIDNCNYLLYLVVPLAVSNTCKIIGNIGPKSRKRELHIRSYKLCAKSYATKKSALSRRIMDSDSPLGLPYPGMKMNTGPLIGLNIFFSRVTDLLIFLTC